MSPGLDRSAPDAGRPACPVCDGSEHRALHRLAAHRMLVCTRCSLVYVDPIPDLGELVDYADAAHRGVGMSETSEYFALPDLEDPADPLVAGYASALELLEGAAGAAAATGGAATGGAGRRLLDVGCGNGSFAAYARGRGWAPAAIDSSVAACETARASYGLEVVTTPFPVPGEHPELPAQSFDAVTFLDFLEHVPRPRKAVEQAVELLAPGGVLLINSPNHASLLCAVIDLCGRLPLPAMRRRLEQYYHRSHVTVFNPSSLRRLVEGAGLEVLAEGQNSPVLERFELPRGVVAGLRVISILGRWTGRESRCWILCRRPRTTD